MAFHRLGWTFFAACLGCIPTFALAGDPFPGTQPLTLQGDLSAEMVSGIGVYLDKLAQQSVEDRQKFWHRDFSSREAYEQSIRANRDDLRRIIGAMDQRLPVKAMEFIESTDSPALVANTPEFEVRAVRWTVFEGVHGEGLWLRPKSPAVARVIVVPDADETPEMICGLAPGVDPDRQVARRLAIAGCEVIVPTLLSRDDAWSGNEALPRFTNQPHREWIYRQAFMLGRHPIGYEVQKILAAVDFFAAENSAPGAKAVRIGVAGYAEGALLAFYSAAVDPRIDAALISGYFDAREQLWAEPIYRNVFGLLNRFGDAEIASLIAPRTLVLEHSQIPAVTGPPAPRNGRFGAAPGRLRTPDSASLQSEVQRAMKLSAQAEGFAKLQLVTGPQGEVVGPGSEPALKALGKGLGLSESSFPSATPVAPVPDQRPAFEPGQRQRRVVRELEGYTQARFRESERIRDQYFWKATAGKSAGEWTNASAGLRQQFWENLIGKLPPASVPPNARSRQVATHERWTAYEVVLDVFPEVFAWGWLLVPNDLKPGERRPVVVCQHGLEGVPADTVTREKASSGFHYYQAFAARLAEQGFITFAPHNPYRGEDRFRVLQRKANPLGKSLFSFIIAQHAVIVDWLATLPGVDPQRIGFYGLSYGGKTAMRVPAVIERYALSICSGDFNEWLRKNMSTDSPLSYMFTGQYEMPEWNLGSTFNYAEMAALIAPRPFMVERGHQDGVGIDEWVAYEYAKVGRFYDGMQLGDRATIEYFNGPHMIHGVGTFEFLHRHLRYP